MPRIRFRTVAAAVLVAGALAVAASGKRTNPPVERELAWSDDAAHALFDRACADCHSYETEWPWYTHVAPVSWYVIDHVNEGREHFNVSGAELGEAEGAAEELRDGEMPPRAYLLLHPEARLTEAEQAQLAAGLAAQFGGEAEEHARLPRDDDD